MTREEITKRFPNASQSFIDNNCGSRIRPAESEQHSRVPLERFNARETASDGSPKKRFKIIFRVFSLRPFDWDNNFCKPIQDLLVEAGILPDDNWRILSGEIVSEKAESKDKERTEITIEAI